MTEKDDHVIKIDLHGILYIKAEKIWAKKDMPKRPTAKDAATELERKRTHLDDLIDGLSFCDDVRCTISTSDDDVAQLTIY